MSPALDHIIVLVPRAVLHDLPTPLTSAFTITPGGTHADGLTENKLIAASEETVDVKVAKGKEGAQVSFDELVVRTGEGSAAAGSVLDIGVGSGVLRIRFE